MRYLQANLVETGKIILEKVEEPGLKEGEALIQVAACGICGSDIHAYHGKHPFMKCPLVMGHEFSGVIEKAGEKVRNFRPGQRVTVEPLLNCGGCYNCRQDRYNLCDSLKVMGCQSTGAYAEKVIVPAEKIVVIPEEMSYRNATLIEPAAVACHAVRRSKVKPDDRVLVIGGGPIGLFTLQMLRVAGVRRLILAEINEKRIEVAKNLGVEQTVNVARRTLAEKLGEIIDPNEIDIYFDCVGGDGKVFNQVINMARRGTKIIAVGIFESHRLVENLAFLAEHELEIIGTFTYLREDFRKVVELMNNKKLKTEGIITHQFGLGDIEDAFRLIDEKKGEVIKVTLSMGEEATNTRN